MNMDKLDIFHSISESKVNLQLDLIKELKNRAGVILGFNVIFLSIIFTNDKTIFDGLNKMPLYFILFSTFLLFCCLFVINNAKSPEPKKFYENYKDREIKDIKEHLISKLNQDYLDNQKQMSSLRTLINLAIWIEVVAVIFLTTKLFPIFKF
jgi:hypothetical protein